MANVNHMRNALISRILTIRDLDVLKAIDELISTSDADEKVKLTDEQVEMLKLSEEDIRYGRVISQEELFGREREWLNEQ